MLRNGRVLSVATLLAGAAFMAACGGSGSAGAGAGGGTAGGGGANNFSQAVVSVGDAPMSNVLSALVTISGVTATSDSGSVNLLTQPRQIELSSLGGIRAPISTRPLPFGTYTSVSLTVSAAQITYVDANGKVIVADATIPSDKATATITLTPPLTVSSTGATDIRFDFDLQTSLDLTGSTVTFTPQIGALVASVKSETPQARCIHVNGSVAAVDTSQNTITLTTPSGLSVVLNVDQKTQFDDSLTLASLQTGTEIHAVATLNSDGSLTATEISDTNGGGSVGQNSRVINGLVTAVTKDSQNDVTSFTLVARETMDHSFWGQTLTVQVNNATDFKISRAAQNAGLTSFDQTQVVPGQALWVAGTEVEGQSKTLLATEIRPAQVNPYGLVSTAVQAGSDNTASFTLLLDTQANFAQYAGISSLVVDTNANTTFGGHGLDSSSFANLAVGTPLIARGFLSESGGTGTLYSSNLFEVGPVALPQP